MGDMKKMKMKTCNSANCVQLLAGPELPAALVGLTLSIAPLHSKHCDEAACQRSSFHIGAPVLSYELQPPSATIVAASTTLLSADCTIAESDGGGFVTEGTCPIDFGFV